MFHQKSPKMDVRGKNFLVPFKVTENFSSYIDEGLLERWTEEEFSSYISEGSLEKVQRECFSLYIKGI